MNASTLKARFLFLGFLFAVFFKFWLIWESEIADATDDPHEYVLQILYPANGGIAYRSRHRLDRPILLQL